MTYLHVLTIISQQVEVTRKRPHISYRNSRNEESIFTIISQGSYPEALLNKYEHSLKMSQKNHKENHAEVQQGRHCKEGFDELGRKFLQNCDQKHLLKNCKNYF